MKKKILLSVLALMLILCLVLGMTSCSGGGDKSSSSSSSSDESSSSSSDGDSSSSSTGDDNPGEAVLTGSVVARYLRVVDFNSESVTLKFNVYAESSDSDFDIRWSEKEITESNFNKATKADYTLSGDVEKTLVVKGVAPTIAKAYWVAVKTANGMEVVRVGGNKLIPIEYRTKMNSVYHGETNNSLLALFDEQTAIQSAFYYPTTKLDRIFGDPTDTSGNASNIEQGKAGMNLSPIIDLEYKHYVDRVELFYMDIPSNFTEVKVRWSTTPVDFMAEDDKWEGSVTLKPEDLEGRAWNVVSIGQITRYVQVIFKDGDAPYEIALYGYQKGEGDKIATTLHKLPTVGEVVGMCGFAATGGGNTTVEQLACANVLREYHNFGWSYSEVAYPGKANIYASTMASTGSWDTTYKKYSAEILTIPCIQWDGKTGIARSVDESGLPVKDSSGKLVVANYWEKFNPEVYFLYADNMYWFAARYGSNTDSSVLNTLKAHSQGTTLASSVGQGTIQWLEFGNEPNGEDSLGYVPYQLAALQSASYDGHQMTLTSTQVEKSGYHFGAVNADPNMKVAMAGLAGLGSRYIMNMVYWLRANRTDGNIAMDAFNFHTYFGYTFYMNSTDVTVGVCPEFFGVVDSLSLMIEYRNKYYPEKEVWLTEFGWDTNQSYETPTSCHAYNVVDMDGDGDIDEDDKFARVHQIQGEWLVRAYILFASCGLDKATMYMCEDCGNDRVSVGKYGTCGIYGIETYVDEKDGKTKEKMVAKDSYYYIYTLKNTLGDYTFTREIATGDDNVWLYEFKNADGKTAYAVWCPTMDGTAVNDFQISINGSSAKAVNFVDNDIDGVTTNLTVTNGKITVDVTESVTMILVD